ncbi:MAG: hypothetical protein KAY50_00525 [Chitinophagaceae bacterium]|nr:hypothetical protein [Chitinophagaceae bacterium]
MTLRDIRSDILLIAQHSKVSKDRRLWESHIDFLIHKYRETAINEVYTKTGIIDPIWIQDLGVMQMDVIDAAEEVQVACAGRQLGKAMLPAILPLRGNNGVIRVSGSSRDKTYYDIDVERFFDLDPTSLRSKFNYYFRIGQSFYLSPAPNEAHFALILSNPMDGFFFDNTIQRIIKPEMIYRVSDGSVTYNGVTYAAGAIFTGVPFITVYTGNGTVYFDKMRRPMTEDDSYPCSFLIAQMIVLNVLTKDLGLEAKAVADLKNDNADQLSLMQQQ